jgi:phosphopantothenoylcysteine decarboxylase / phosphopantothenate---cysteine ligase
VNVVVGVSGGIAAYKACELVRELTESGLSVRVVPTANALRFVGVATWEALSRNPVRTEVWDDAEEVAHVRIGREADLVVIAPATADLMAKAAAGLADDLLTATLLTATCPVVYAPAMHTEMWEHAATRANVATLRERGAVVIEPAVGRLTGPDTGKGRLPEPEQIALVARLALRRGRRGTPLADLAGRRVLVSAGGTREFLDPVRYLGNRSSGRQGYALAQVAAARGAKVTLVAANTALPDPAGVDVVRVTTTNDLAAAVLSAADAVDAVVMAAAPADFRPTDSSTHKIKKAADGSAPTVTLAQNPDVLASLVGRRKDGMLPSGLVVVGFAAETGDPSGGVLDHARAKLARKGCDLLVVNDVSAGKAFDTTENAAVVLGADGSSVDVPYGPKEDLADAVWDLVAARLPED